MAEQKLDGAEVLMGWAEISDCYLPLSIDYRHI
jgi:hypothetical protein